MVIIMMKLSLMLEFFKTVNEEWKSPIAERIASSWFKQCEVKVFRASANFVCVCKVENEYYFLRFNREDERRVEYYQEEIKLLNYLLTKDIKVSEPVKSLNGNFVESVETEIGVFNTVCFKSIRGEQYDTEELDDDKIFAWGKSLGKLHHQLKGLDIDIKRPNYQDIIDYVSLNVHNYEHLPKIKQSLETSLALLSKNKDDFGLIHFDFESDNLVFKDQVYSLDYDDCGYF